MINHMESIIEIYPGRRGISYPSTVNVDKLKETFDIIKGMDIFSQDNIPGL